MIRIFLPLLCAVLGLATAACGQSGGPFGPAESAGSSPDSAAAAMANPPQASSGAAVTSPAAAQAGTGPASDALAGHRASTLIGMPVVSADGSPLGEVKDIIFDSQGRATHVVIADEAPAADGAPNSDEKLVAVPWETALAHISDDHLVLDSAHLANAPSFTPEAWPNLDDPAWSVTADAYWRKVAAPPVTAHGSNPVDSPARQRGRRTRDADGDGD